VLPLELRGIALNMVMMELRPGQVVEFFRPVQVDGKMIPKGTRARVAHILAEFVEPKVVLVLLGEKPEPVIVERHAVTVNSILVNAATH
jgi:hypothetical protein